MHALALVIALAAAQDPSVAAPDATPAAPTAAETDARWRAFYGAQRERVSAALEEERKAIEDARTTQWQRIGAESLRYTGFGMAMVGVIAITVGVPTLAVAVGAGALLVGVGALVVGLVVGCSGALLALAIPSEEQRLAAIEGKHNGVRNALATP